MTAFPLDWLNIAILLGAAQGFLLSGVLATQRKNQTANRLLAVMVFAFSLQMISTVYHAVGYEQVFPHFFGVAYPLPMLYGPLVFLYAVMASDRTRRLRTWDPLHFAPFVLVMVDGLPIYLQSGAEKLAFYEQLLRGERPFDLQIIDVLKLTSGVAYTVATIVFLRLHAKRIKDNYSTLARVNLQWLVQLAIAGAAIWAMVSLAEVGERLLGYTFSRMDDYTALALAALVYGIGYMALRQPEIFSAATAEDRVPQLGPLSVASSIAKAPTAQAERSATRDGTAEPRYARSGLSAEEAGNLKKALLETMEQDRPFTESNLTLTDLAGFLDTTPHKLSEVINSQLHLNFYDFVNGYRVKDVQQRLTRNDSQNVTLLALALDAGFASKSTFNDVFKKHSGMTPSAYRRMGGARTEQRGARSEG